MYNGILSKLRTRKMSIYTHYIKSVVKHVIIIQTRKFSCINLYDSFIELLIHSRKISRLKELRSVTLQIAVGAKTFITIDNEF